MTEPAQGRPEVLTKGLNSNPSMTRPSLCSVRPTRLVQRHGAATRARFLNQRVQRRSSRAGLDGPVHVIGIVAGCQRVGVSAACNGAGAGWGTRPAPLSTQRRDERRGLPNGCAQHGLAARAHLAAHGCRLDSLHRPGVTRCQPRRAHLQIHAANSPLSRTVPLEFLNPSFPTRSLRRIRGRHPSEFFSIMTIRGGPTLSLA